MTDAANLRTRLARKPIVVAPGVFDALVGRSSAQIELRGRLTLATAVAAK